MTRRRYSFREYLSPRVLSMLALGFSSGLPFLMVGNTFGYWLRDEGTTVFLTTHYLEEAESHCDRIAIMHLGKIAALGTCKELETSLGDNHTLNDVFVHYAGSAIDSSGNLHDVGAERATAQRLG